MIHRLSKLNVLLAFALGTAITPSIYCHTQDQDSLSTTALKRRSLEELMNMDITIVAKQSQRWFESAAAVYVIPNEDIRRSGARSIPEALRLAPNLNVAQISSSQWAVSARGFNSTTSNKLLVLIDGRTVYNLLFSGVFWDTQDVLLEDVDRIEVSSGPGGTLWGPNAVNGIINIITKTASETSGKPFYLQTGAGIAERFSFAVRSGGTIGTAGAHRVYLKYFEREQKQRESGVDANDSWSGLQGGYRMDCVLSPDDDLTLEGDLYRVKTNQFRNDLARMEGGDVLAKWRHRISERSSFSLSPSFTYTHRRFPNSYGEDLGLVDVDFEHQMGLGLGSEVSWGVGIRHGNDRVINSAAIAFLPPNAKSERYTAFIQGSGRISNGLKITVGSKFIKPQYSQQIEAQPRVSIGWARTPKDFLWASITRAVRTPSRIDLGLFAPGNPPYFLAGGPNFISEKLVAFEGGYRVQPSPNVLFDLALFYNIYDDVRSVDPGPPQVIENDLKAKTYGGEITASFQITDWWRVRTGYSHLQKFMTLKAGGTDVNGGMGEGNDHKHRLLVQSLMNIAENWEIDLWFRFVDKLPNANAFVPAYTSLDCRVGWNAIKNMRFSILVQNVFPARHVEFGTPPNRQQIGREVYGTIAFSM